jgi:hypothetical protein
LVRQGRHPGDPVGHGQVRDAHSDGIKYWVSARQQQLNMAFVDGGRRDGMILRSSLEPLGPLTLFEGGIGWSMTGLRGNRRVEKWLSGRLSSYVL